MNTNRNLIHRANALFGLMVIGSILIAMRPFELSSGESAFSLDPALLMILAQIGGVLIPALLFLAWTRQPITTTLKLRAPDIRTALACLLIGLLCWPLVIEQSNVSALITALSGPQVGGASDIVTQGGSPWISLLGIVLVAPLFEELLFRGVFLDAYETATGGHAIWLVAVLFAVYHFSPENFLLPLVIGLLAGWLAYRTRSIWAGVLVHVGVNLLAGLMILLGMLTGPAGAEAVAQSTAPLTLDVLWLGVLIWGGIGLAFLVPVVFLLRRIGAAYPAPKASLMKLSLSSLWSYALTLLVALVCFQTLI